MSLHKFLPQVLTITPRQREITHFHQAVFFQKYIPPSAENPSLLCGWNCQAFPWTHRLLWSSSPTTDPKKAVILVTSDPYRYSQMPRDTLGRNSVINFDNDPQKSKNEVPKIRCFEYKIEYINLNLIGKFPAKKLKLNVSGFLAFACILEFLSNQSSSICPIGNIPCVLWPCNHWNDLKCHHQEFSAIAGSLQHDSV